MLQGLLAFTSGVVHFEGQVIVICGLFNALIMIKIAVKLQRVL